VRFRVDEWRPAVAGIPGLLRATYEAWRADRTIRLGAGLAYYGLFSLSSVVAVAVGLFRIISRSDAVEQALIERLDDVLGPNATDAVQELAASLDGSGGTQLGLIGLGSLLVTGSLFFLALEDALNLIWGVPVRSGVRSSLRRRAVSLLVLLGAAATIVASMAVQAASSIFDRLVPGSAPGLSALASLLTNVLGWGVLAGALVLLFRYVPSIDVPWRPVLIAAVVTSIFLVVGTALIGWYLRTFGASSVGGVVSSPILILLWIYYEAQILLAGAQLGKVLARGPAPAADTSGVGWPDDDPAGGSPP
jgi:membrane protein